MKVKELIYLIFILAASAILSIGRFYDERLDFFEIKFSLILSLTYFFSTFVLISSIRKTSIEKSKILLYSLYAYIIVITPILWVLFENIEFTFPSFSYDHMQYGFLKFINFLFIVVPISIIIIEKFRYRQVTTLINIFFLLALFLALLGVFGLFSNFSGRLSVLGGGPIVYSRWMCLAILILIFYPKYKFKLLNLILIISFLLLAFATGSRGPLLSLFITLFVFFILNYIKLLYKVIILFVAFIGVLAFTPIGEKVLKSDAIDRVTMNIKHGGSLKSTGARMDFTKRSISLISDYPFGVGCGNWQTAANDKKFNYVIAHAYPHNLFFELTNEYGVLAGLLFLFLILHIFYLSFIKMKKNRSNITSLYPLLFYALIFLFLNTMLSGDLMDGRILFVFISLILINKPLVTDEK